MFWVLACQYQVNTQTDEEEPVHHLHLSIKLN